MTPPASKLPRSSGISPRPWLALAGLLAVALLVGCGQGSSSSSLPPVPANASLPVITGTPQVGSTLTTTPGTWTGSPTSFSYQWNANNSPISGANSSTYTLSTAQLAASVTVTVTARNASGVGMASSKPVGPISEPVAGVPFNPLHLYYISPTGKDANSGTSPTDAWATPNHPVQCGDVILAAPGSYTTQFNQDWGTVSDCPSTIGGIDGSGGIFFATLLCAGADLEACPVNPGPNAAAFDIEQRSNWAVEGFKATTNGANTSNQVTPAFDGACGGNKGPCTGIYHHFAFVNDIAYNSSDGFSLGGYDQRGVSGVDYFAVVGDIAQNSAQGNPNSWYCVAAIDLVAPINYDTAPGTHMYLYGNFSYNNQTACPTDVENYMFDTWDANGYSALGVAQNNIGWLSGRFGFNIFDQETVPASATAVLLNNTLFASNQLDASSWADGDINIQNSNGSGTAIWGGVTLQNNLVAENQLSQGGDSAQGPVYAFLIGGAYGNVLVGGNGTENLFNGLATECRGPACAPASAPYSAVSFGTSANLGDNLYADPAFSNTSDLLTQRSGIPNCTGFHTTTACMGLDANSQQLTKLSPIADLQPTSSSAAGKGYQLPSTNCVSSGAVMQYYPTWLKGIVYLQWHSDTGTLTENSDLVTKPCSL